MKFKTITAPLEVLNYAVASCEGKLITLMAGVLVRENDGMLSPTKANPLVVYQPTVNWSQGGPIVNAHRIDLTPLSDDSDQWAAIIVKDNSPVRACGETALIAAMRCYILSKMGNEIETSDGFYI